MIPQAYKALRSRSNDDYVSLDADDHKKTCPLCIIDYEEED